MEILIKWTKINHIINWIIILLETNMKLVGIKQRNIIIPKRSIIAKIKTTTKF